MKNKSNGKQVTRKVAGKAIKYVTTLYEKGVSRIRNRRVRNASTLNFAKTALNYGKAYEKD